MPVRFRIPLVFFAVLNCLATICPVGAEEIIAKKVIALGDTVQVLESGEVKEVPMTSMPSLINWVGPNLAVRARGTGIWDGSSYTAFIPASRNVPEGYDPGVAQNSDGNPPENPQVSGFSAMKYLHDGRFGLLAKVDDAATEGVDALHDFLGVASTQGFESFINNGFITIGQFLWANDGSAVLRLSGDSETSTSWIFPGGTELDFPSAGDSAEELRPGSTHTNFGSLEKLFDDRSMFVRGGLTLAEGGAQAALFRINPEGQYEVLLVSRDPAPEIDGLAPSFFSIAGVADMNESREVAFRAVLRDANQIGLSLGVFRMSPDADEEKHYLPVPIVLTGVDYQIGTSNTISFSSMANADVHISESGDVYFEAVEEGNPGNSSTVWRALAENGALVRVGPSVGSPIPGYGFSRVTSTGIVTMGKSGRLLIKINGWYREEENGSEVFFVGYFFQNEFGVFSPAAVIGMPITPGGGTVTNVGEGTFALENQFQISDTNSLAMVLRVDNVPSVYVFRNASEVEPVGDQYHWNGGAGTDNWHTVTDGRSNWTDSAGAPWPTPPPPNAEVYIPKGPDSNPFQVELLQSVPEIAKLEVEGLLEMHAALTVKDSLIIMGELNQRNGSSLISEGNVEVDGEMVAWENGIRTETTDPDHLIETKGMIDGLLTGIWAKADNGVQIDNRAMVGGDQIGIFTETLSGLTFIANTGDVTSTDGIGIRASSLAGPIEIQSPGSGGSPVRIASNMDAIYATTAGAINVEFNGEINTIADDVGAQATGIRAVSTGGPVNVKSQGSLTGASSTIEARGISAIGSGNVFARHIGRITTDGWGITGESTGGNVVVEGRGALINSGNRGLVGKAPNGTVTIYGGEMAVGKGTGIAAEAGGEVTIEGEGPISTLGGLSAFDGSPGIHAVSSDGGVSIKTLNGVSTAFGSPSPAIIATAESDVLIESNGELSTLTGDGMELASKTGTIEVTHQNGPISVSGLGAGIRATSELGSILISSNDPESRIGTLGISNDTSTSDGIHAIAGGSISISWAADIEAYGLLSSGIYANSDSAGISVTTSGDVSGNGDGGNGVLLVGPSNLTLNILGGSVGGAGTLGAGVRFSDGADNMITNHGNIASFDGPGILTMDGNETIENHGGIAGNINLGGGTNVLTNHPGSELFSHTEFNLGAGNTFDNSGLFQIGEEGEAVVATVLTGNWIQQGSARFYVEFQDTNEGSSLTVNGSAILAGKLRIRLQDFYEPMAGDTFTLVTADSLSGVFSAAKVIEGSVNNAPLSRKFKVDMTYTASSAVATIAALNIERYSDWREGFFSESDAADETISGAGRDPDGDGYNNLAEYALGGDPGSLDPDLVTYEIMESSTVVTSLATTSETPTASESVASISFNWANDVTDATWEIERSPDLENWEAVDSGDILMEPNGDYTRITATPQAPLSPDESLFLRVQIQETPQP